LDGSPVVLAGLAGLSTTLQLHRSREMPLRRSSLVETPGFAPFHRYTPTQDVAGGQEVLALWIAELGGLLEPGNCVMGLALEQEQLTELDHAGGVSGLGSSQELAQCGLEVSVASLCRSISLVAISDVTTRSVVKVLLHHGLVIAVVLELQCMAFFASLFLAFLVSIFVDKHSVFFFPFFFFCFVLFFDKKYLKRCGFPFSSISLSQQFYFIFCYLMNQYYGFCFCFHSPKVLVTK
jgi:hypothetical protein